MAVEEIFKALGDPTRLEMIRRLTNGDLYTAGTLSHGLGLTRQGARKHLRILENARLVSLQPYGRELRVSLQAASLQSAKSFITRMERRWDTRLQTLRKHVE